MTVGGLEAGEEGGGGREVAVGGLEEGGGGAGHGLLAGSSTMKKQPRLEWFWPSQTMGLASAGSEERRPP